MNNLFILIPDKWSPALQIRTVLLSIQALMSAPNPDDPLANDVAELWKSNEEQALKTGEISFLLPTGYFEPPLDRWFSSGFWVSGFTYTETFTFSRIEESYPLLSPHFFGFKLIKHFVNNYDFELIFCFIECLSWSDTFILTNWSKCYQINPTFYQTEWTLSNILSTLSIISCGSVV